MFAHNYSNCPCYSMAIQFLCMTINSNKVIERYGIHPTNFCLAKSIVGDKSDNIPGVPGVGDKPALGMLQGIGSIEAIYQNLDKIADLEFRGAKKMADKMREFEEQARLSYELATIKLDVPLQFTPEQLTPNEPQHDKLVNLFAEYDDGVAGNTGLWKRLPS